MRRITALLGTLAIAVLAVACSETDAGVTTKIKSKLAADDTVKAYQIDVDTRDKVVTLSGSVDSAAAKTQAVHLARQTEGVTSVVDNIVVNVPQTSAPPMPDAAPATATIGGDATITAAVKAKLLGDPDVSGLAIDVDTEDGVVTLSGRVNTAAEKAEAIRLARETDGVRSVTDKLTTR